MMKTFCEI